MSFRHSSFSSVTAASCQPEYYVIQDNRSFLLATVEMWRKLGFQLVTLGNPDKLVMVIRILLSFCHKRPFISATIVLFSALIVRRQLNRRLSPYSKLCI